MRYMQIQADVSSFELQKKTVIYKVKTTGRLSAQEMRDLASCADWIKLWPGADCLSILLRRLKDAGFESS